MKIIFIMSNKILNSLPSFIDALEHHQPIECDEQGKWKISSQTSRSVKKIFHKDKESEVLRAFHQVLSKVETYKIYFNCSAEILQKQTEFYQNVVRAGRVVIKSFEESKSTNIQELCNSLELSIIKLQYRIQLENGGSRVLNSEEVDADLLAQLQNEVEEWQKSDEKYEYTKQDYSTHIREICQYPELARFLLNPQNKNIKNEYFQRALRDNFSIEVLNQYHYESKALAENFMSCRIGAIARKLISVDQVTSQGTTVKVLNLLMENKKINILDKTQTVRFSNGLEWKLSRIYRDFREKNDHPGDLEIMWDGIVPFNGHELGARIVPNGFWSRFNIVKFFMKPKYEFIDTTQPGWYEKTPVLDIRSKDYIENRYNVKVEPNQWVVILEATRRNELDVDKAHGYSLFYQPLGNDNYRVYSFGVFPLEFPQNTFELVNFVGDTVPGTIAMDPNYYYSQSQKASWPQVVAQDVAHALLEELGICRKLGVIFQLGWENCAYFMRQVFVRVFEKLSEPIQVPQFFEKKFSNTKVNGALKVIQKILAKVSKELLHVVKVVLAIFFRATRARSIIENGKKVKKSLWTSPFFEDLKINVPSAFHYRIKKDLKAKEKDPAYKERFANCVLNYGHCRANPVATAA